jgi:hypothetical protein
MTRTTPSRDSAPAADEPQPQERDPRPCTVDLGDRDPRPFCERCHTRAAEVIVANGRGGSRFLCAACHRKTVTP